MSGFNKCDWRKAALLWEKYSSPFRPSRGDIENYSSLIDKYGQGENLLLGATPELRALFSLRKLTVTLVDFSQTMIKRMLRLDKDIDQEKETWLVVDWLMLNKYFKKERFDLIIGDLILRNIEPIEQERFLKIISYLLSKNGVFIARSHLINESVLSKSSDLIIKESLGQKTKSRQETEDLITSRLLDKNTDFRRKKTNKAGFKKDIERYLTKKTVSGEETIILNGILDKWAGERTWTQRTKKEIKKMFSQDFVIKGETVSSDYIDSNFYPIYILEKIIP